LSCVLDGVQDPGVAGQLNYLLLECAEQSGSLVQAKASQVQIVMPDGEHLQFEDVEGGAGETLLLLSGRASRLPIQPIPDIR